MAPIPQIKDTWAISLVLSAYSRVARAIDTKKNSVAQTDDNVHGGAIEVEASGDETSDSAPSGTPSSRQPANKAGGQRRKGVAKKK